MEGGSGNYIWMTLNSTFVSVNKKGLITTGNQIGEARIKVSDMKNPAQSDECIVKVLPPADMTFILGVVEVEVGKELNLPISVTGFASAGIFYLSDAFWTYSRSLLSATIAPNLVPSDLKKLFPFEMVKNDIYLGGASKQNALSSESVP